MEWEKNIYLKSTKLKKKFAVITPGFHRIYLFSCDHNAQSWQSMTNTLDCDI